MTHPQTDHPKGIACTECKTNMTHKPNCYYYGAGKHFTSATRSCTCLNTTYTSNEVPTPEIPKEKWDTEKEIGKIIERVRYVEFLRGVPVRLPSETIELLRSGIRATLARERATAQKEKEAMVKEMIEAVEMMMLIHNGMTT